MKFNYYFRGTVKKQPSSSQSRPYSAIAYNETRSSLLRNSTSKDQQQQQQSHQYTPSIYQSPNEEKPLKKKRKKKKKFVTFPATFILSISLCSYVIRCTRAFL